MKLSIEEMIRLGLEGLFYILLLCFAIQTVFLAYHWFTYGTSKQMSLIALLIYLAGGALFLLTYQVALTL